MMTLKKNEYSNKIGSHPNALCTTVPVLGHAIVHYQIGVTPRKNRISLAYRPFLPPAFLAPQCILKPHFFLPIPVPLPACNASNKPSLPPCSPSPHLRRGVNAPDNPGPAAGCRSSNLFVSCIYPCLPLFLPDLTFSSFLPSRRIARLQVFQLFLSSCLPPGISIESVVVYFYNSFILACTLGLDSVLVT